MVRSYRLQSEDHFYCNQQAKMTGLPEEYN